MKKKLVVLLALSFLSSCGSWSTKSGKKIDSKMAEEFSWIENADFSGKKVKPVKFNKKNDVFKLNNQEMDSLSKETIANIPKSKLDDLNIDSGDKLGEAISFCYSGDYEKGFSVLDKLYLKYKKHPGYWNQVGTCYLLKGEEQKALLYYNKSRSFDKKYAPPINNLGVLYEREGKHQKALAAFQEAQKLNSFSLTPIFNVSILKLRFGFIQEACAIFRGLYKRNKKDVDIKNAIATCLLFKKDVKSAISIYQDIDKDFYIRPDISINYAVALSLSGDQEKAKDILDEIEKPLLKGFEEYFQTVENFIRKRK